jgi:5S rRNA maturation endonuclease (ribonuclease M5)
MNKDIAIITEGEFDAKILQRLLKDKRFKIKYEVIPANGYSSALSKVKSLMTVGNKRIILLLDADTTEESELKHKEDFVNSYVNTNLNKDNFKAFWAVPEFEIIFLSNKKFITELTRKSVSSDVLEIGKTAPKRTLETISSKKRDQYMSLLDKKEVRDEFFKTGLVKEIADYLAAS